MRNIGFKNEAFEIISIHSEKMEKQFIMLNVTNVVIFIKEQFKVLKNIKEKGA